MYFKIAFWVTPRLVNAVSFVTKPSSLIQIKIFWSVRSVLKAPSSFPTYLGKIEATQSTSRVV